MTSAPAHRPSAVRRVASTALALTALFAAGPGITAAHAATRPAHPHPHVHQARRPPVTTVDVARTSREPRSADVTTV